MRRKITRRKLLADSSLIALSSTVPGFVHKTALANVARDSGRVLVVIQLDGGNDGINTVVPFRDEGYARHRKVLRLPTESLLKVHDDVGLHPSMRAVADLMDDGRLGIVQGVGYPNPNRSHEVSMAIWQTGNTVDPNAEKIGWIGKVTDAVTAPSDGAPHSILVGTEGLPLSLHGRRSTTVAMAHLMDLQRTGQTPPPTEHLNATQDLRSFVARTTLDAFKMSDLIDQTGTKVGNQSYPSHQLAGRLKMIAQLIKSGFQTPIYYAIHGGFDTHSLQLDDHERILYQLSSALKAFLDDLRDAGIDDRVLVMCFSEFGRRVAENASQGTDHGTAGPVFLAGPQVQAGLIGATPSLTDLVDGDLRTEIDFRDIYASIQTDWLGTSPEWISPKGKSSLKLFRPTRR
ncbi:MAG: DUF1501 domain-containing protein [Planctomycetales bacterium]|nr:DUF1501 domain-containing protein [Planctomycetales bacterium]